MTSIVTKDSLNEMLRSENKAYVHAVIGRALSAILQFQTNEEKNSNETHVWNNIGFNGPDARSGSLTAKYWLKHGKLEDWMAERWLKVDRTGYPRICKYARQLNMVAEAKQQQRLI